MGKDAKGHGRDAEITECLCGHAPVPYAKGLCLRCYNNKYMREHYHRTKHLKPPDYYRRLALKSKFGLTLEEYDVMLNRQGGVCKICSRPQKNRRLAVDHNHETGAVRGLLCGPCNTALSHVEHKSNFSAKALVYLREYQDTTSLHSVCESRAPERTAA